MTTIRRIRSGEGSALRDVRLRALRTDPDAFAATHEQASSRFDHVWEDLASTASAGDQEVIFLVEDDEGVVGMVGAFARPEEPATRQLYGMWVAPDARGSGVGAGMVEAVIEWSKAAGADEVKLWVVESNLSAVRLYQKAGFVPTGEAQPLPSNPELIDTQMRLTLS